MGEIVYGLTGFACFLCFLTCTGAIIFTILSFFSRKLAIYRRTAAALSFGCLTAAVCLMVISSDIKPVAANTDTQTNELMADIQSLQLPDQANAQEKSTFEQARQQALHQTDSRKLQSGLEELKDQVYRIQKESSLQHSSGVEKQTASDSAVHTTAGRQDSETQSASQSESSDHFSSEQAAAHIEQEILSAFPGRQSEMKDSVSVPAMQKEDEAVIVRQAS